jgi:hypothetical protein
MLKSKVSFIAAWSAIAAASAFCLYTAGLLYFFSQTLVYADDITYKSHVASGPLKTFTGMVTVETNYGTIKFDYFLQMHQTRYRTLLALQHSNFLMGHASTVLLRAL